jgi:hypothetical protein
MPRSVLVFVLTANVLFACSGVGTSTSVSYTAKTTGGLPAKIGAVCGAVWSLQSLPAFSWGQPSDVLVFGDWNGSGTTKAGVFRAGVLVPRFQWRWPMER